MHLGWVLWSNLAAQLMPLLLLLLLLGQVAWPPRVAQQMHLLLLLLLLAVEVAELVLRLRLRLLEQRLLLLSDQLLPIMMACLLSNSWACIALLHLQQDTLQ